MNITPDAAVAIQGILGDRNQIDGGLRIFIAAPTDDASRLDMSLVVTAHPDPTDEVVAEHGSQVFVEERLSPVLAGKTLDVAKPTGAEGIAFRLIS